MKAVSKYALVVVALFVLQALLGALTAHYTVEGRAFFGIPIGDWEAVFEPFVRIGGRRAGADRGSGIGLFAARRLMDAMGGRVWLEPNGYGGSRFVVALPAA